MPPSGQWGEKLSCVLWAAGRDEWLEQTRPLSSRRWNVLLPQPGAEIYMTLDCKHWLGCDWKWTLHPLHLLCVSCPVSGWGLWTEREAWQAGLPAPGPVLGDHWFASRWAVNCMGHAIIHPPAREHLFPLLWGDTNLLIRQNTRPCQHSCCYG